MQYLLDTHTFLWSITEHEHLSKTVRDVIKNKANILYLSAASAWEISVLWRLNRIELPDLPERFIPEALRLMDIQPLSIGFTTAMASVMLPPIHKDPFDRILIAEALIQKLTILSKDKMIAKYDVDLVW